MDEIDFKNLDFEDKPKELKPEPILEPNTKRFVLFPIHYNDIWQAYKNLESRFWTAEDIELEKDVQDYESLHGKTKSHLLQCIVLLSLDLQSQSTLSNHLSELVTVPEARCFYGFQMMQSNVHLELFNVLLQMDSQGRKAGWMGKYFNDSKHIGIKLLAFAISLSIFQSSILDLCMHLSKEEKMPGLVHALAKVKHDRDQFVNFCHVVRDHAVNTVDEATIKQMVVEAVSMECQLVDELKDLSTGYLTIGNTIVDFQKVKQRVGYCADTLLKQMNVKPMFGKPDPLQWIEVVYQKELKLEQPLLKVAKPKSAPKQEQVNLVFDDDF